MLTNKKETAYVFLSGVVFVALALLVKTKWPISLSMGTIELAFAFVSAVLTALFFLYTLKYRHEVIAISWTDIAYGSTVVISLLSFFFVTKQPLLIFQPYVVFTAFTFYLLLRVTYHRLLFPRRTLFTSLFVSLAGIQALQALRQFFSNSEMKGFVLNMNFCAMITALAIPLALALIWQEKKSLPLRILLVSVALLLLTCVLLSECRTAYVGLVLALGLMFSVRSREEVGWKSLHRLKFSLIVLGTFVMAAAILTLTFTNSAKQLSAVGRLLVWKVSLRMFFEHPVSGVGFSNFSVFYAPFLGRYFDQGLGTPLERLSAAPVLYVFNDYLQTVVELGVVGLIVFGLFWVLILKNVWGVLGRVYRRSPELTNSELPIQTSQLPSREGTTAGIDCLTFGAAGSLLLYMAVAFFYFPSGILPMYLIFCVLLAWIVSENQRFVTESGRRNTLLERLGKSVPPLATGLLVASSLVSLFLVPSFYRRYAAERDWSTAQDLSSKGQNLAPLQTCRRLYPYLKCDAKFFQFYGGLLLDSGNESEAIAVLEDSRSCCSNPFLLEKLAVAYQEKGEIDAAIKNALLASSMLPWRLTSRLQLADLYNKQGNSRAAMNYARLVLETPMKIRTDGGGSLKAKALEIWLNLGGATSDRGNPQLQAISFLPAEYRLEVLRALQEAGVNAPALTAAINAVDPGERGAMAFLIANMPEKDLKSLQSKFLIDTVQYAYKARKTIPLAMGVDEQYFLNYVLPYAVASEEREDWRPDFYDRFKAEIAESPTVEEAVMRLNRDVFTMFQLSYIERNFHKILLGPYQSIEEGSVSCGDASVMVVNACRAVGIPARMIVLPQWSKMGGGHTWVEVYDKDRWRSLSAYDSGRLDESWMLPYVEQNDPTRPECRVYATSFERTKLHIVFGKDVSFLDVTNNYIKPKSN
jgi:O-antigen ligase/transglutaminase-like putative cysteine protease